MFDRSTTHSLFALLLIALTGCATFKSTPKQDYVWAMWDKCKMTQEIQTSTMSINRVDSDGQYWSNITAGPGESEWPRIRMNSQFRAHPYLDWLKSRQAATQPGTNAAVNSVKNDVPAKGPITAPTWRVGDEWEYAYKGPSDSGTYVWSVNRLEALDGVQQYVVKSGTREIFYRASDLASSLERVDGIVVLRETPPRVSYTWPLTVGQSWEVKHRQERPVDRQTTDRNSVWTVEAEETVTVPAGTFRTFRIVWRNKNTGAMNTEVWYAPDVKQWVKIREVLFNGIREREMVSFRLK
jgi:hypothetical protein